MPELVLLKSLFVAVLFEGENDDEDCRLSLRQLSDFNTVIESVDNIFCYKEAKVLIYAKQEDIKRRYPEHISYSDFLIFEPLENFRKVY